jgi:hypothetical protein
MKTLVICCINELTSDIMGAERGLAQKSILIKLKALNDNVILISYDE